MSKRLHPLESEPPRHEDLASLSHDELVDQLVRTAKDCRNLHRFTALLMRDKPVAAMLARHPWSLSLLAFGVGAFLGMGAVAVAGLGGWIAP